jgi:hypothetical protein
MVQCGKPHVPYFVVDYFVDLMRPVRPKQLGGDEQAWRAAVLRADEMSQAGLTASDITSTLHRLHKPEDTTPNAARTFVLR